ncbi:MAG: phosphoribosyltransferase family protein [Candidatus Pacebacteria bacterium]|nr:phosphoribosyltransferase family protein [Candidatus Paceibacterota bacterium]
MSDSEVLELLQNAGVFRTGHFVFISGKHSETYVNKDALYPYTREISKLCKEMANRFASFNVDAVIGPAVGAAILSQWTAYHLSERLGREVFATYADKDGQGGFIIKRGYDKLIAGKRVLIVEDSVTTGGSMRKVIDVARIAGAEIVGAIAICNRGSVRNEDVGVPHFESLVTLQLEQWPQDRCELCERGIPVNTDLGHGREFLAHKA